MERDKIKTLPLSEYFIYVELEMVKCLASGYDNPTSYILDPYCWLHHRSDPTEGWAEHWHPSDWGGSRAFDLQPSRRLGYETIQDTVVAVGEGFTGIGIGVEFPVYLEQFFDCVIDTMPLPGFWTLYEFEKLLELVGAKMFASAQFLALNREAIIAGLKEIEKDISRSDFHSFGLGGFIYHWMYGYHEDEGTPEEIARSVLKTIKEVLEYRKSKAPGAGTPEASE